MRLTLGIGKTKLSRLKTLLGAEGHFQDAEILCIATHSEEVEAGDLFCVLNGKRDAYPYIEKAIARGAAAVLTDQLPKDGIPYLLVEDTLAALERWATLSLEGHSCRRIAITGSVGKTGTKNTVRYVLSSLFRVHASEKSYNNLLGVPFTVLTMPKDTEILITELGTNHPGEIGRLARIVRPTDAVITSIGHAHIGAFGSREAIAREKLSLLENICGEGKYFFPANEPLLRVCHSALTPIPVQPINELESDVAAAYALAFAEEIGRAFGKRDTLTLEEKATCIRLSTRRKEKTASGIRLIDDAYNASPESVLSALKYLESTAKARRVLVLSDMRELGEQSVRLHEEIGEACAHIVDLFMPYGENATHYTAGADNAKVECTVTLLHDKEPLAIAKEILPHLKHGDTVLFKGSRLTRADEVANALFKLLNDQ